MGELPSFLAGKRTVSRDRTVLPLDETPEALCPLDLDGPISPLSPDPHHRTLRYRGKSSDRFGSLGLGNRILRPRPHGHNREEEKGEAGQEEAGGSHLVICREATSREEPEGRKTS